jgi:SAM-dependent methyltransferase
MAPSVKVLHGDCRDVLAALPDNYVHSVVTDPPYELGFMGKSWDASGVAYSVDLWREVLRVLKPGGHLCAFGGTRTYHRMTVAIEDAGFEIRDSLHWVYGCLDEKTLAATPDGEKHYRELTAGSLVLCYDVETGVYSYQSVLEVVEYDYSDTAYRLVGDYGEQVVSRNHRCIIERSGSEAFEYAEALQSEARVPVLESLRELRQALRNPQSYASDTKPPMRSRVRSSPEPRRDGQPLRELDAFCDERGTQEVRAWAGHRSTLVRVVPFHYTGKVWCLRVPTGAFVAVRDGMAFPTGNSGFPKSVNVAKALDKAGVADSEILSSFEGFGTALKPAHEPIVLARKPFSGTVVANVLDHGAGVLNIDGCRVSSHTDGQLEVKSVDGRWPANIIFDEAAGLVLDSQSGVTVSGKPRPDRGVGGIWGEGNGVPCGPQHGDAGGASRFFTSISWEPDFDSPFRYFPKPSRKEKDAGLEGLEGKSVGAKGNGLARTCVSCGASVLDGCDCEDRTYVNPVRVNHHPTVKPVSLMRWLVKLVTPPDGVVLDPFAGSGTTLMAAVMERFAAVGIEMTDEYLPIIEGRVKWASEQAAAEELPFESPEELTLWNFDD